jgi:hypothetical protein
MPQDPWEYLQVTWKLKVPQEFEEPQSADSCSNGNSVIGGVKGLALVLVLPISVFSGKKSVTCPGRLD